MDKLKQQISDILKAQAGIGATNEDIIAWRTQKIIDVVMECMPKEKTEDDLRDVTWAEILSFNRALMEFKQRLEELK